MFDTSALCPTFLENLVKLSLKLVKLQSSERCYGGKFITKGYENGEFLSCRHTQEHGIETTFVAWEMLSFKYDFREMRHISKFRCSKESKMSSTREGGREKNYLEMSLYHIFNPERNPNLALHQCSALALDQLCCKSAESHICAAHLVIACQQCWPSTGLVLLLQGCAKAGPCLPLSSIHFPIFSIKAVLRALQPTWDQLATHLVGPDSQFEGSILT